MSAVKATYSQRGESIDYSVAANGTALEANEIIVIGTLIGVCGCDIGKGETGSVHIEGVYAMPLKASTAVTIGAAVYWDATNKEITTTSTSNTLAGHAIAAAASGDDVVYVKINA